MFSERSEQDVFKCLSWLYDGFELPGRRQQPVRREMGRTA
jgi:hypothetical protein